METPIDFTLYYVLYYLAWFTLSLVAAVFVYKDANKLPTLFLNSKPTWWAAATLLLGPVWVILAYWLIHHSTISNRITDEQ